MNDEMMKAYRAAEHLVRAELGAEDRALLDDVGEDDVLVARGQYDRVEDVLRLTGLPHRVIAPDQVASAALRPDQLLIINCPGHIGRAGVGAVRRFVEQGGSLLTTDWALRHVLEPAFPGLVAYNEHPTADDVVRVEIADASNRFLAGMFHDGADPLWWLEGSSYPIRILDRERVRVLLTSAELAGKYGEAPVAIAFAFGEGEVLHMISHHYLQRAELRTARHQATWSRYAAEVGLAPVAAAAPAELASLCVGEVEAAHKSLRFMTNVILEKRRQVGSAGG